MSVVKTTFNLAEEMLRDLERLAKKRDRTISQTIRNALATSFVINDAMDREAKVLILDKDGSCQRLVRQ